MAKAKHDYMASIDDTKTQESQEIASASAGGFREWKTGANILRILPPVANTGWTKGYVLTPVWQYWRIPPAEKMCQDIRRTFGPNVDDPMADCLDRLHELGVDTTKLEGLSRPAFYANVVDLADKEPVVQIQKFPKGLANWILEQLADDQLAGRGVLDPYNGSALSVKYDKDHKDKGKIYQPSWHPGQTNRPIAQGEGAVEALMAQSRDLADIFQPPEGEDLAEIVEIAKELFEYAAPVEQPPVNAAVGNDADQDDLPF